MLLCQCGSYINLYSYVVTQTRTPLTSTKISSIRGSIVDNLSLHNTHFPPPPDKTFILCSTLFISLYFSFRLKVFTSKIGYEIVFYPYLTPCVNLRHCQTRTLVTPHPPNPRCGVPTFPCQTFPLKSFTETIRGNHLCLQLSCLIISEVNIHKDTYILRRSLIVLL